MRNCRYTFSFSCSFYLSSPKNNSPQNFKMHFLLLLKHPTADWNDNGEPLGNDGHAITETGSVFCNDL